MTYATKQNLIDRYGQDELVQLSDRGDPPTGLVDDDVVNAALADADSEINAYISVRVTTPVSPVPDILVRHACGIARYLLWKDRASEKVAADYATALAFLKAVAAGTAALGDAVAPTAPPTSGAPQIDAPRRRMSRHSLRGY